MANRLEQEFPRSSWRMALPSGARGLDADPVQRSLDRGRCLRNQAIRTSVRRGIAVVAQTISRSRRTGTALYGPPAGLDRSAIAGRGPRMALDCE